MMKDRIFGSHHLNCSQVKVAESIQTKAILSLAVFLLDTEERFGLIAVSVVTYLTKMVLKCLPIVTNQIVGFVIEREIEAIKN